MIDCLTYNKDLNVILDVGTQAITASLENSSITNFVYAKRIESENIELIGTYGANYIYTYPLDNQLIVYIFSNRAASKPILFYQSPKLVKLATYMPEEQFGIFYNLKFCSDKNFIVKKLILET